METTYSSAATITVTSDRDTIADMLSYVDPEQSAWIRAVAVDDSDETITVTTTTEVATANELGGTEQIITLPSFMRAVTCAITDHVLCCPDQVSRLTLRDGCGEDADRILQIAVLGSVEFFDGK